MNLSKFAASILCVSAMAAAMIAGCGRGKTGALSAKTRTGLWNF